MDKNSSIYVAGHTGLVGGAIVRALNEQGYKNIITATHKELDLTIEEDVYKFFYKNKPDYVILAAAKVGGILANDTFPVNFISDNLQIQTNVLGASYKYNVKKLLFLGSSCIYPRDCEQPIKEEYLMTGKLEETNSAYAVAKIAGIEMCKAYNKQYNTNFICAMPCNLYGIGDNFNLQTSHVLPAIIAKTLAAKTNKQKEMVLWGDGTPRREFLFSDDLADACLFLMDNYDAKPNDFIINVGYGRDMEIKAITEQVAKIVKYAGKINWDTTKPNGTPKKLIDSSKIFELGWKPKHTFEQGLKITLDWYSKKINQD